MPRNSVIMCPENSCHIKSRCILYQRERKPERSAAHIQEFRNTIYRWRSSDDLHPKVHRPRHRKMDKDALKRCIQTYPDVLLSERAYQRALEK
ncbi:IS630 transposase-related protein [Nitrosococcus watsonii]|uniref:Transposase family protein n=1 Tax=Nitrosococcus watsoni (strain C-113) TaxID=105559 RepID=D8K9U6_NITWC|nr:transposase family protein [Nitrosococcus watsonii C-113]